MNHGNPMFRLGHGRPTLRDAPKGAIRESDIPRGSILRESEQDLQKVNINKKGQAAHAWLSFFGARLTQLRR
jgi:hypothetical protein